jgi:hypothetical protein
MSVALIRSLRAFDENQNHEIQNHCRTADVLVKDSSWCTFIYLPRHKSGVTNQQCP